MIIPSNREIDAWIGEKIMDLAEVGYYRRKSIRNSEWERCYKEDYTPDEPKWKADLYYITVPGHMSSMHSIPQYTDDINLAFEVIEKIRKKGYVFLISTMFEGVQKYSVTIRGCKHSFDSMHSDLITVSDIHPAKAICVAVCNLYELLKKKAENELCKMQEKT